MVRRGSTVRVRQRASEMPCKKGISVDLCCLSRRAGERQGNIREHVTPSRAEKGSRTAWVGCPRWGPGFAAVRSLQGMSEVRIHIAGGYVAGPNRTGNRKRARASSAPFAWLHNRRRLLVRTDRREDIHESLSVPDRPPAARSPGLRLPAPDQWIR